MAHGLAGHVQPQHGEHAAHLAQQMRYLRQLGLLRGVAEIGVEQLLNGAHVGAQLLHHAAHGLGLGGLAEQVFHPTGERVGRQTVGALVEAVGEDLRALQKPLLLRAEMGEGDFEEQDGRGDIERTFGCEKVGLGADLLEQGRQRLWQRLAARHQGVQRLAQRLGQLAQTPDARGVDVDLGMTGQGAPGLAQGLHPLSDLLHQRRIDQAEMALVVVGKGRGGEIHARVDGAKHGQGLRPAAAVDRLGTEKGQVVSQTLRRRALPLQLAAQLQVEPVEQSLDVEVGREQAVLDGFEQATSQPPQTGCRPLAAALSALRHGIERLHRLGRLLPAQHLQQARLELGPVVGVERGTWGDGWSVRPGPVVVPEVGGMDALGLGKLHQIAILRIELECGLVFPGALGFEEVDQGVETGVEALQRSGVELFRMVDQAVEGVLGGLHQASRAEEAQQFDGARSLVHLGVGGAQPRQFSLGRTEHPVVLLLHRALERGPGRLQVVADLIEQPGQRPHVRLRGGCHGGIRSGDCVHAGKREGRTLGSKRKSRIS